MFALFSNFIFLSNAVVGFITSVTLWAVFPVLGWKKLGNHILIQVSGGAHKSQDTGMVQEALWYQSP